jgi:hypothetical protein
MKGDGSEAFMKIILLAGIAAIVAGGVYLHGPLRNGETYDRTIDEAYETVRNMPMPRQFGRMVENVPGGTVKMDYADQQAIVWRFTAKGKDAALFKVEFTPVDEPGKVYVSTSYEPLEAAPLLFDGSDNLMSDPELFDKMARVSMREQVDARLERRPFNQKLTQDVMAGWVMKNVGNIQQEVSSQMKDAVKSFDEMDKERELSKQRAEAAKFSTAKPMNEAKPMSGGR